MQQFSSDESCPGMALSIRFTSDRVRSQHLTCSMLQPVMSGIMCTYIERFLEISETLIQRARTCTGKLHIYI